MKIICIYAPGKAGKELRCNSGVCPHRLPHNKGELNEDGGCQWAKDPHCIPCDKHDLLEELLKPYFLPEALPGMIDRIEEIYEEGTNE